MARPPRPLHKIELRERRGKAYCWYRGQEFWFGDWDMRENRPTPEALLAFQRQIARWSDDPSAGQRVDDYLVCQLANDWLDSDSAPPPGRAYEIAVESLEWLLRLHARTELAMFGAAEFQAWQAWLCQQVAPRSKKRMRRETILRHRLNVLRALRYGTVRGKMRGDQLAAIEAVGPPARHLTLTSQKRLPVSAATVRATLAELSPEVGRFVRLLWWTGARVEELARLNAEDIVRSGWIETPFAVRLNLDRFKGRVWAAVLTKHKQDHVQDRVIFFGPRAQRLLTLTSGPLFTPWRGKREGKRVRKVYYDAGTIRNAVQRAAKRAGVPKWFPRQVRQAFARRMMGHGLGESAVACCLGHTSPKVTARYTDRDLVTAARVYAKYG